VAALITIDAVVGPALDVTAGATVTLANDNDTGVTTWAWELVSIPDGSLAVLSSASAAAPTVTLDTEGSYLILLTTNATQVSEASNQTVAAVLQVRSRIRVPATGETTEAALGPPTEGWAPSADTALQRLDRLSGDANVIAARCQEAGGLARGQLAWLTSSPTILTGLPGEEAVPGAVLATAADELNGIYDTLYAVEGAPASGGTSALGEVVLLRRVGFYALTTAVLPGPPAVGTLLYLNDTGDVDTAVGTVVRVIGRVLGSSGTDVFVYFVGDNPAGGDLLVRNVTIGGGGDLNFVGSGGYAIFTDAGDLEIQPDGDLFFGNAGGANYWKVDAATGALGGQGAPRAITGVLAPLNDDEAVNRFYARSNFAPSLLTYGTIDTGSAPSTTTYLSPGFASVAASASANDEAPIPTARGGSVAVLTVSCSLVSGHDDNVTFEVYVLTAGVYTATGIFAVLSPATYYASDLGSGISFVVPANSAISVRATSGVGLTVGVENAVCTVEYTRG
jgi:hypothetical protein